MLKSLGQELRIYFRPLMVDVRTTKSVALLGGPSVEGARRHHTLGLTG